jgi:hypothetical protein
MATGQTLADQPPATRPLPSHLLGAFRVAEGDGGAPHATKIPIRSMCLLGKTVEFPERKSAESS